MQRLVTRTVACLNVIHQSCGSATGMFFANRSREETPLIRHAPAPVLRRSAREKGWTSCWELITRS